ncbi:hypothetical protein CDL12_09483 [Handroanthus impetiginosus]|uniref:COX assembly mitochondrial protein n=1 Tax=Handroanthus impetiginosus TaxID=429701 RepID=A0A2G9HK94_9LAMI|nr:hypothetical protein CDL12_09483 [Handroanthus impetiginosus]
MHPPLTIHRHPIKEFSINIIEQFQKCHLDHPVGKFFGKCTDLKIELDQCFRQEKAVKRKANFEESKKLKERVRAYRKENSEIRENKNFAQV